MVATTPCWWWVQSNLEGRGWLWQNLCNLWYNNLEATMWWK